MNTLQAVINIDVLKPVEKSMRRFSLLLTAILVTACGGSTEPTSIDGTYTLRTINGTTPPVLVWTDQYGETGTVKGGSLALRGDGSYTLSRDYHYTGTIQGNVDATETETGTFAQNGGDLTLTQANTSHTARHMQWSGNQVTWTDVVSGTTSTYLFVR